MSTTRRTIAWAAAIATTLAVGACDETPTTPDVSEETSPALEAPGPAPSSASMANSDAPFQEWYQGFDHGTTGWLGNDIPGMAGWCGEVEQVDGRADPAVGPSAGRGYATAAYGACNAYWQANYGPASGPFSPGAGFSSLWPDGGFVYELDVYLDPAMDASFQLAASFQTTDFAPQPTPFRYLLVQASSGSDAVAVMGQEVRDPGWYTFRFRFGSSGGHPTAEFELRDGGRVLTTHSFANAINPDFTSASLSSFDVENLRSGYVWFVSITEGVDLPIDEHRVRRGR